MTTKNFDWPFSDPPNVAVFTSKSIVEERDWIHYVSHDQDDGAWQFHPPSGPATENDASLGSLRTILELDPSIITLADLPLGWCAWREAKNSPWKRKELTD